jgi:LacI family transcriptional regulator
VQTLLAKQALQGAEALFNGRSRNAEAKVPRGHVDEVCRRVAASRSTLERRMKQALDRTPKEEIQRLRFRQVEQLLRQTDLTIEAIAQQTGFTHSHYLQAAFRERHGMTPGQYRTTGRQ